MPIDSSSALAPSASTSGLFVHVHAAVIATSGPTLTAVPQQNVAVARLTTNWIFFDLTGLTVVVNQSGFVDPCIPIGIAVTDIDFVSALTDSRPDFLSIVAGGGGAPGNKGEIPFNDGAGNFEAASELLAPTSATFKFLTQSFGTVVGINATGDQHFIASGADLTNAQNYLIVNGGNVNLNAQEPGSGSQIEADGNIALRADNGNILMTAFAGEVDITAVAAAGLQVFAPLYHFDLGGMQVFANNAAALAGGLVAGDLYRTGANPDVVCIVH